jgi:CheY-like chemotaxis protein
VHPIFFGLAASAAHNRRRKRRRPQARAKAAQPQLRDLPVLIVDDDAASAKLMSVLLRGEGCQVQVAHSAEEALTVIAASPPKLILLDLVLPLMSGLLLAQKLKADPATESIVIIAVTAFNGVEAERVAFEAGCAAYARKPIDPLSFTQLLLAHLGGPKK